MRSRSGTPSTLTTAYASNTRAGAGRAGSASVHSGWCGAIARLVAGDHAFLPLRYGPSGCLYRGVDSGASALLTAGESGLAAGAHALNRLERELGVVLVSADLSDALSVARLWEAGRDACVIAFDAAHFAHEARAGRAAVLAFAEPGVVFRYPLLALPLPLDAACCVFVRDDAPVECDRPDLVRVPAACGERAACADFLHHTLATRGLRAAAAATVPAVPGPAPPA